MYFASVNRNLNHCAFNFIGGGMIELALEREGEFDFRKISNYVSDDLEYLVKIKVTQGDLF